MAILISKTNLRAQSKGAMTNTPLADPTFTESPFCLEDTMKGRITKLILVTETPTYCRRIANEWMRNYYPEIDWYLSCVHHIDHNPCNNNLDSLLIMDRSEHIKLHNKGVLKPRPKKTLPKLNYLCKSGNRTDVYTVGEKWRNRQIMKVSYSMKKDCTIITTKRV